MPSPQQLSNQFSQIAKTLEPAVVNINTESTIRPTARRRGGQPTDGRVATMTRVRLAISSTNFSAARTAGPISKRSLGSGVLVDAKGYIVTNRHVVEKADRIRVRLQDDPPGVQHDAKVIGSDQETDLAVIKIDVDKPSQLRSSATRTACRWVTGSWRSAVRLGCRQP